MEKVLRTEQRVPLMSVSQALLVGAGTDRKRVTHIPRVPCAHSSSHMPVTSLVRQNIQDAPSRGKY